MLGLIDWDESIGFSYHVCPKRQEKILRLGFIVFPMHVLVHIYE